MYYRYELILTVDDAGMVSVLRKNIKLVILFNPWCPGNQNLLWRDQAQAMAAIQPDSTP